VFWIGLAISFVLNFADGLSHIAGPVGIPLYKTYQVSEPTGPLVGIGPIYVFVSIWAIAIAYLIPTELSFSVWALWIIRILLTMAAIAFGADAIPTETWESSVFPAPFYQSVGAAFALLGWWIWRAKGHLRHAVRVALGRETSRHEASEPLPYRLALLGLVISFATLVAFCRLSGTQLLFGVTLMGLIVGSHVVWARLSAETGMAFMCWPLQPTRATAALVGSATLRHADVMTASTVGWASIGGQGNTFQVFASRSLETFKVADSGGISSRQLTGAVVAAFVFALAVGLFVVLTAMYNYGYTNTALATGSRIASRHVGDWILWIFEGHEPGPDIWGLIAIVFGGLMAIAFGVLHTRLWWWPLHPIGYLVAFAHAQSLWIPFFIGWMCKSLVVRYGGLRLYRRTIPLAVGLIVGDLLNKMLWAIVMLATGGCF
jgi:hypothetical protein